MKAFFLVSAVLCCLELSQARVFPRSDSELVSGQLHSRRGMGISFDADLQSLVRRGKEEEAAPAANLPAAAGASSGAPTSQPGSQSAAHAPAAPNAPAAGGGNGASTFEDGAVRPGPLNTQGQILPTHQERVDAFKATRKPYESTTDRGTIVEPHTVQSETGDNKAHAAIDSNIPIELGHEIGNNNRANAKKTESGKKAWSKKVKEQQTANSGYAQAADEVASSKWQRLQGEPDPIVNNVSQQEQKVEGGRSHAADVKAAAIGGHTTAIRLYDTDAETQERLIQAGHKDAIATPDRPATPVDGTDASTSAAGPSSGPGPSIGAGPSSQPSKKRPAPDRSESDADAEPEPVRKSPKLGKRKRSLDGLVRRAVLHELAARHLAEGILRVGSVMA